MRKSKILVAAFAVLSLMLVGVCTSCSSDDDDFWNDGDSKELLMGDEVRIVNPLEMHCSASHDTTMIACFYSMEELEADLDYRTADQWTTGVPELKKELPDVDWSKQTLLLAKHFSRCIVTYKDCKVREKKGKYLVELYYTPTLCQAYGGIGAYIVIDKPNISAKNISIRGISVQSE